MTKIHNKITKLEIQLANAQTNREKTDLKKTLAKLRKREFNANHQRRGTN